MREKHGDYDYEKKLPTNLGKPVGSGYYVWLNKEVSNYYGEAFLAESQQHGDRRYRWIIEQLSAKKDDPHAQEIVALFTQKRKADAAQSRQNDRRRMLARYEKLLEGTEATEGDRKYWSKQVKKLKDSIEKAEAGTSPGNATT